MKNRLLFYGVIVILTVVDSYLLASPNLLGKIGLFIYKYQYLRTFPKTLLTTFIVVFASILITELIHLLIKKQIMRTGSGRFFLLLFVLLSVAIFAKTAIDFSTWTYGHTGTRFKYGAYLLPVLLINVFGYALFKVPKVDDKWPESPSMNETKDKKQL
jgi:hypothetical protein